MNPESPEVRSAAITIILTPKRGQQVLTFHSSPPQKNEAKRRKMRRKKMERIIKAEKCRYLDTEKQLDSLHILLASYLNNTVYHLTKTKVKNERKKIRKKVLF
ncbi:MAG: hypothetical protein QW707_08340 [Candidatus Bathyarchaeia archaeon]